MRHYRDAIPLEDGFHLDLSYALRCVCQGCGRILKWGEVDNVGVIAVRCCKLTYELRTIAVRVTVCDRSPEVLLPPHREGFFPLGIDVMDYAERPPADRQQKAG